MADDAIYIDIEDEARVKKVLDSLSNPSYLAPAVEEIGATFATDLAKYPRPPENSSYRRTGNLMRGWTHKQRIDFFGFQSTIGNIMEYSPLVQDRDRQAEVHQGRWQTIQDVQEERMEWMLMKLQKSIEGQIRRNLE